MFIHSLWWLKSSSQPDPQTFPSSPVANKYFLFSNSAYLFSLHYSQSCKQKITCPQKNYYQLIWSGKQFETRQIWMCDKLAVYHTALPPKRHYQQNLIKHNTACFQFKFNCTVGIMFASAQYMLIFTWKTRQTAPVISLHPTTCPSHNAFHLVT